MNIFIRIYKYVLKRTNPIKFAKKIGVSLGEGCRLIGSPNWGSEPWLISIGNYTEISFDCAFITHDGAIRVIRTQERYKDVIKLGKIVIGNNCFIGARSIILPGVTIGDNSIVAAGSVVNKNIPAGSVWGGVPAHFIMTVDEYAEKCLYNNPDYDKENFSKNYKDEVMKIVG